MVGVRVHFISVKALELAFDKKALRQVCENEMKAKRDLGVEVAGKLKSRLADLRAATTIKDMIASPPRELGDAHNRHLAIDLSEGRSIVFCSNHLNIPLHESGEVDWSRVSRIKILRIAGDHE